MNSNNSAVEVIDLSHYWLVIRRHLKKIIALSALVTVIAALVALAMTPVFKATTTLMIEAEDAKIVSIEEVYGLSGNNSEYFLTQFEILKSRDLARRVVERLNLVDVPEFNSAHPSHGESFSIRKLFATADAELSEEELKRQIFEDTVDAFWEAVTVSPVRKTQLVKVSVFSESPALAAQASNAMAQAYIDSQLEAKTGLTQQASGWLEERLGGLKDQMNQSEARLQAYRDENNLVDVKGVNTLLSKELDQITEKLIEAKTRRLELESSFEQVKSLKQQNYESLSQLPVILAHNLVTKLRENETKAELKVSELSKRYGPKHPKMIAAKSDLDAVRSATLIQMKRLAAGIENDFIAARQKEQSLNKALAATKAEVQKLNRTEFKLNEYVREVNSDRALYQAFFKRVKETAAAGDLQAANARIVDVAVVPKFPAKPNKKLIVALALVVSLMFGIALVFLLDALDATIKNADDVDYKLKATLLGVVPLIKNILDKEGRQRFPAVKAMLLSDDHGFKESVRTLRTGLTLATLSQPAKTLLFTSSVPGEGKTTTSVNFAAALAQNEKKVLLIDADMRRPTVAKQLQLAPGAKGLSNAVAYPETLDQSIHHIADLNIDVIPAGPIPPNPLELLASKSFENLLVKLADRYDQIIVDSAPMGAVSDALYLSSLTDGVVYVIKADATKDKLVQSGLTRLDESNARILGVILNQVDVEKEARYGNHYSGYYDAYAYGSENGQGTEA